MTKETISTFLPIVNIGILPKSVKSKAANPEIKLLKISVLFLQLIRYHVIDSLMKLHVNHLRCLTFGYPVLVRCVVCLQFTPTVFSYDWIAFLKSASSFDFEHWKKRSRQRMKINPHRRQVYLSFLTMFPARVPGHLKTGVQCTIRTGQYKHTVLLISLLVII